MTPNPTFAMAMADQPLAPKGKRPTVVSRSVRDSFSGLRTAYSPVMRRAAELAGPTFGEWLTTQPDRGRAA